MLGVLHDKDEVAPYLRSLKDLQDAFGSMNDAAMAHHELSGPDAPARDDPDAQRAVGWVLGTLAARESRDRPALFARWDKLAGAKTFW
jgi:triphosphatase